MGTDVPLMEEGVSRKPIIIPVLKEEFDFGGSIELSDPPKVSLMVIL